MAKDLILMLLSLIFGIIAAAYSASLVPIFGVAVACLAVPIWQFSIERKVREAEESRNWARKRAYSSGAVYVATSRSIGWMKVGYTTKSAEERCRTLNSSMEGGQDDWTIEIFKHHWRAGRLENAVHKKLNYIKIPSSQIPERKNKRTGRGSKEIFELDTDAAQKAVRYESWKIILWYLISTPILASLLPVVILALLELVSL